MLFVSASTAPQDMRPIDGWSALSDDDFAEVMGQLNGTPSEVLSDPELLRIMLPGLRADFEIAGAYRHTPEPPFAMPIAAYAGTDDMLIPRQQMLGWRAQTDGRFSLTDIDGGHFFLNTNPTALLPALCLEIKQLVDGLDGRPSSVAVATDTEHRGTRRDLPAPRREANRLAPDSRSAQEASS
jgi:surfactin synthase thioesterase subunit